MSFFDLPVGSLVREKAGYPPYVIGPGEVVEIVCHKDGEPCVKTREGYERRISEHFWEPMDPLIGAILMAHSNLK